jgi:hypothetical protein
METEADEKGRKEQSVVAVLSQPRPRTDWLGQGRLRRSFHETWMHKAAAGKPMRLFTNTMSSLMPKLQPYGKPIQPPANEIQPISARMAVLV